MEVGVAEVKLRSSLGSCRRSWPALGAGLAVHHVACPLHQEPARICLASQEAAAGVQQGSLYCHIGLYMCPSFGTVQSAPPREPQLPSSPAGVDL